MAKFEGVQWAPCQMQYLLGAENGSILPSDATSYTVSRSLHYGLFLVFEGIRFFVRPKGSALELCLMNWDKNLARFCRGMSYSLSQEQGQNMPQEADLERIFLQFFRQPSLRPFLERMANTQAQGYFRPYTLDEDQSIGVTFPGSPSIRGAICSYERYLGEPFEGVVIPHLVRAVSVNQTGSLKLGTNYLISVKAVEEAQRIVPQAAAALFLDDAVHLPLRDRNITEWDSSCCLFALRDGSLIKIPEGPLILPSVTIRGIVGLARARGITVVERHLTYGELLDLVEQKELVAVCSLGTAGILNRCQKLHLIDENRRVIAVHEGDTSHALFKQIADLRLEYWELYKNDEPAPDGLKRFRYDIP